MKDLTIENEPSDPSPGAGSVHHLDAPRQPQPAIAHPERWLDEHGDYLFRYASLRVRDPHLAEDLVQDTFLAAIRTQERYAGRSSERTWLVGILRHKLLNFYRRRGRETAFTNLEFYAEAEASFFHENGLRHDAWIHERGPIRWHSPSESLERDEFWRVLKTCTAKMPANISQAFLMREMDGTETQEICQTLQISANHLGVMLHRARMSLRRCLELNWFKSDARQSKQR